MYTDKDSAPDGWQALSTKDIALSTGDDTDADARQTGNDVQQREDDRHW